MNSFIILLERSIKYIVCSISNVKVQLLPKLFNIHYKFHGFQLIPLQIANFFKFFLRRGVRTAGSPSQAISPILKRLLDNLQRSEWLQVSFPHKIVVASSCVYAFLVRHWHDGPALKLETSTNLWNVNFIIRFKQKNGKNSFAVSTYIAPGNSLQHIHVIRKKYKSSKKKYCYLVINMFRYWVKSFQTTILSLITLSVEYTVKKERRESCLSIYPQLS